MNVASVRFILAPLAENAFVPWPCWFCVSCVYQQHQITCDLCWMQGCWDESNHNATCQHFHQFVQLADSVRTMHGILILYVLQVHYICLNSAWLWEVRKGDVIHDLCAQKTCVTFIIFENCFLCAYTCTCRHTHTHKLFQIHVFQPHGAWGVHKVHKTCWYLWDCFPILNNYLHTHLPECLDTCTEFILFITYTKQVCLPDDSVHLQYTVYTPNWGFYVLRYHQGLLCFVVIMSSKIQDFLMTFPSAVISHSTRSLNGQRRFWVARLGCWQCEYESNGSCYHNV